MKYNSLEHIDNDNLNEIRKRKRKRKRKNIIFILSNFCFSNKTIVLVIDFQY